MNSTWTTIVTTMPFLWEGLRMTLLVSALVVAVSLVVGIAYGIAFALGPKWLRWPLQIFSDIMRGTPLLVVIFTIFYLLPFAGINLNAFVTVVLALSLFKTAHVGEITRGAIQSIPKGQFDAAKAVGLTPTQVLGAVVLPLATRRFLPPWINSVTDAVKGSSLVSLVGIVDLMLAAQQVIGRTYEPLPVYMIAAAIYFLINFSLSTASKRLEARFAHIQE